MSASRELNTLIYKIYDKSKEVNVELYLNDDKIDNSNAQVKIAEPNISVVKTSDKQKYEYYENATYSIVITNNGNGIAYNITIKDVLPLGLKYKRYRISNRR